MALYDSFIDFALETYSPRAKSRLLTWHYERSEPSTGKLCRHESAYSLIGKTFVRRYCIVVRSSQTTRLESQHHIRLQNNNTNSQSPSWYHTFSLDRCSSGTTTGEQNAHRRG